MKILPGELSSRSATLAYTRTIMDEEVIKNISVIDDLKQQLFEQKKQNIFLQNQLEHANDQIAQANRMIAELQVQNQLVIQKLDDITNSSKAISPSVEIKKSNLTFGKSKKRNSGDDVGESSSKISKTSVDPMESSQDTPCESWADLVDAAAKPAKCTPIQLKHYSVTEVNVIHCKLIEKFVDGFSWRQLNANYLAKIKLNSVHLRIKAAESGVILCVV